MKIRAAVPDDSAGIAEVHVASWKTTYRGIVPDNYLSNLSVERRRQGWESMLLRQKQDEFIYVLEDEAGTIVGFVSGGVSREPGLEYEAELYAIYMLQQVQGKGYGKQLFSKMKEVLKEQRYRSMMLWVVEDNPSIHFYEKMGGLPIAKKEIEIGGETVSEVALGWTQL